VKKSSGPRGVIPSSRWAAYASAGLATVFGCAPSVEAEIHYSGPVKEVFDVGSHSTTLRFFDLQGGARFLFDFARFGAGRGSAFFAIRSAALSDSVRASQSGYPSKLHLGDPISAGTFFPGNEFGVLAEQVENGASQWKRPGSGFIGFRFDTGSGVQYGWARVRTKRDNAFILVDYAWGDPGEAITAGQMESSTAASKKGSLGSLALGAAGLDAWRQARGHGVGGGDEFSDSH
jgi:hypothetical protein